LQYKKVTIGKVIITIISIFLAVIFIFPVIWMFAVSFKTEGTPIKNVSDWFSPPYTLENFPYVFQDTALPLWIFNSFFIAIIVTLLVVLFTSMAAFALSKLDFRYKHFMYILFLVGLMVPGEATIIPLFVTVKNLNIIDSYAGLIMPAIAGSMSIIILKGFFDGIPNEIIESATIDGAGLFTIYGRIILPLGKTALVTMAIFTFIGNWNSFLWPYLCAMSEDVFTLPVGIPTLNSQYTKDYVIPMTTNVIASLPAIVLFLIFEKQIVKGVTLSGIKG
jgi:multiple sugar transport system permease protein